MFNQGWKAQLEFEFGYDENDWNNKRMRKIMEAAWAQAVQDLAAQGWDRQDMSVEELIDLGIDYCADRE